MVLFYFLGGVAVIMLRRSGIFLGQNLRYRSLAAGPGKIPGNFFLLQLRGFSGPARWHPLQARGKQKKPVRAHSERLRTGRRPDHGRHSGKLPAGRRFHCHSGSIAPLYGRTATHRSPESLNSDLTRKSTLYRDDSP